MKRFYYLWFAFLSCILPCCTKQKKPKNIKLAHNHFKAAITELSDEQVTTYHYKKALASIEQAITIHKKPEYLALQATLLFTLGQEEQSLQAYEQALACCTQPSLKGEILNNYACLLAETNRKDQAIGIWQELETDPHYLTPEVALVNRGKISLKDNDYQAAEKCFQKSVNISPSYLDAHFYLALAAQLNHHEPLAKQEIKTLEYLNVPQELLNRLKEV